MPQLVHEPRATVLSTLCTNHQWRRNGVRKRESGAVRLGQTVFFSFLGWTPFYFFFLRLATSFYVDDWDGQHSFNIDDWDGQHFLCWWLKWVTIFYVDDWEAQHFFMLMTELGNKLRFHRGKQNLLSTPLLTTIWN